MEENKNIQGINKGLIMALIGWLLSTISMPVLATVVFSILDGASMDFSGLFDAGGMYFVLFGAVMLIIWIPAAIITGKAYRKKGFQQALTFTIAAYVISIVIFFGCTGSLRGING
ncbi:MAG: hypothetical protein HGA49_07345 [Eubacteriaceae bacterium]|nr:hypothetical protein [Eubacteriaceae bacterium]